VTVAGESLSVNFLSVLFGTETVQEFRTEHANELTDENITGHVGVADETYPAKKGAKKALREENARRNAGGEAKNPYPEGFCLASAYLPQVGCFAGLQCQETDFAWLLAATLVSPLEGVDCWIADEEPSYNGTIPNKEECLFHEVRQIVQRTSMSLPSERAEILRSCISTSKICIRVNGTTGLRLLVSSTRPSGIQKLI